VKLIDEQTGKQVLEQVREALRRYDAGYREGYGGLALALDGCVILTAGEADYISRVLNTTRGMRKGRLRALAFLTERSPHKHGESGLFDPMPGDDDDDDIGPPLVEQVRYSLLKLQAWIGKPGSLKWSRDGLVALNELVLDRDRLRAEVERLSKPANDLLWLANNMHNYGSRAFMEYLGAAIEDAREALRISGSSKEDST